MKTVLRPVLALFLSAALCVCLLPAAYADGALFTFPDGTVIREELANPDPLPADDAEEAFGDDGYVFEVTEMGSLGAAGGAFSLPTGTTRIEAEAFAGCVGMKSVTIPGSVTSIGAGAFSGCGQLSDIYFDGTAAQWNGIGTESGNEALENALVHFRDGTLRIPVSAAYFPDEAFRAYVADTFDKDGDGWLSSTDISRVTMINCSGTAANRGTIQSLRGIELFPNLTELYCTYNRINALDVSGNKKLRLLACSYNELNTLDISGNPALQSLYVHYNHLTRLNTAGNPNLTGLFAIQNAIAALDLRANTKLSSVEVSGNGMTALYLNGCTALKELRCGANSLQALNVSTNTLLEVLDCHSNLLRSISLGTNTALRDLDVSNNRLTTLNVSGCKSLERLQCYTNLLSSLTLGANSTLDRLNCAGNQLPYVEIRQCAKLLPLLNERPVVRNNIVYYFTDLDSPYLIYDNAAYLVFGSAGVPITAAYFPDPTFRTGVHSYYDKNTDGMLSTAEARAVDNMFFGDLETITSLKGIEYFTALKTLRCNGNPLTELDVSALTNLQVLECHNTYITTLDIRNNTSLRALISRVAPTVSGGIVTYFYSDSYLLRYNNGVRVYY